MKAFGSSQEVVTLGLSLFVFGSAVGPMVLSPLSEVSTSIFTSRSAALMFFSFMAGNRFMSRLFSSS